MNDEHVLSEEKIREIIRWFAICKMKIKNIDDFMGREIDIFKSYGYGMPENFTYFFCVKGSPNKLSGFIVENDYTTIKVFTDLGNLVVSKKANFKH
jgi:hypothetical protein